MIWLLNFLKKAASSLGERLFWEKERLHIVVLFNQLEIQNDFR